MLERASGVQAIYPEKPSAFAFQLALQSMALPHKQVVMVGDRVSTDVLGAHKIGMQSVLVRTGEFRPMELENHVQPEFILDSIQELPDIVLDI